MISFQVFIYSTIKKQNEKNGKKKKYNWGKVNFDKYDKSLR